MLSFKKLARFVGCALLAGAVTGPAAAAAACGGQVATARVVVESGVPFLIANGLNPHGCQNAGVLALPTDAATRDEYLSLALTAFAANIPIEVYVDGCATTWPGGTVEHVYSLSILH